MSTATSIDYREQIAANLIKAPHTRAEITPRFANAPRLRELSLADVLAMGTCYEKNEPGKVAQLATDHHLRGPVTILTVVSALRGKIPHVDLMWLLTRPEWYERPLVFLRWLAADFAAGALPIYERETPEDRRPRQAIEAARQFALDMIDDAARDTAGAAARDAARDTAGAAARDTAGAAARDAARDTAGAAARDTAGAAARAAARDTAGAAAWDAAGAAARAAARDT